MAQGHAGSVVEAALRFAITGPALSTVLIGCSDLAQLEFAATAVNKGPLPPPPSPPSARSGRACSEGVRSYIPTFPPAESPAPVKMSECKT